MRALAVVCVLFAAPFAQALTVPLVLTQQGRLLDGSDQPVNGQKHVVFELYDTDNSNTHTAVWHEEQDVTFSDGRYAVVLGDTSEGRSGTPITSDVLAMTTLYLSTSIDGTELLPRLRVTSTPYALRAGRSAEAETVLDDGVATNALQDQAVTTPKLADGSVTLAKLSLTGGKFVGLDADTLDGLDSSAFAPSSLVDAIGQPPEGSSIAAEIASIKSTAQAGATASALSSVDAEVSGLSTDLANDTSMVTGAIGGIGTKVDATAGKVDGVASQVTGVSSQVATLGTQLDGVASEVTVVGGKVDGVATQATGLDRKLGTPAGASVSADVAALATQLTALKTELDGVKTELDDRKWQKVTDNLYPNLDAMLSKYPLTDWQWGIDYNGNSIVPVTLNGWDGGIRIASIYAYTQGDSLAGLRAGGFTLLKGLPSGETSTCNDQNKFLHFYTLPFQTGDIRNDGNGCVDLPLFVRRY